jgi:hypothetical protein
VPVLSVLELVQELAEYLAVRYPSTFHIERHIDSESNEATFVAKGWGGTPPVKAITNIPLGVTYKLNEDAEDMMRVAGLLSALNYWGGLDSNSVVIEPRMT